jgi:hypothetical protein
VGNSVCSQLYPVFENYWAILIRRPACSNFPFFAKTRHGSNRSCLGMKDSNLYYFGPYSLLCNLENSD